jgi:hypothetical protein
VRTIRTMVIAACGVAASLGGPAAQGWTPSRGGFACSGLIGEVCASDGHAPMCLALAWRAGRLDLVSAAGGGGPMEGATTIRFGGRSTRTTFVFDGRAADAMGVAAARARVLGRTQHAERGRDGGPSLLHARPRRELRRATAACARRGEQRP